MTKKYDKDIKIAKDLVKKQEKRRADVKEAFIEKKKQSAGATRNYKDWRGRLYKILGKE